MGEKPAAPGLGALIRQARKQRGLRQEDLGPLVGVGRERVSHWETGKERPDGLRRDQVISALKLDENAYDRLWEEWTPAGQPTAEASIDDLIARLIERQNQTHAQASAREQRIRELVERLEAAARALNSGATSRAEGRPSVAELVEMLAEAGGLLLEETEAARESRRAAGE